MVLYAVLIFAIAAIGGLVLASSVLRGKLAAWAISVLHALLGASGLVLLIFEVLKGAAPGRLTAALGLLVVAALVVSSSPRSTCASRSHRRLWCACTPALRSPVS